MKKKVLLRDFSNFPASLQSSSLHSMACALHRRQSLFSVFASVRLFSYLRIIRVKQWDQRGTIDHVAPHCPRVWEGELETGHVIEINGRLWQVRSLAQVSASISLALWHLCDTIKAVKSFLLAPGLKGGFHTPTQVLGPTYKHLQCHPSCGWWSLHSMRTDTGEQATLQNHLFYFCLAVHWAWCLISQMFFYVDTSHLKKTFKCIER